MGEVRITVLADLASEPDFGPMARLAEFLGRVTSAATACHSDGLPIDSMVRCRRRPGRRPCSGRIVHQRSSRPSEIRWSCPECGDGGVIRGFEGTAWDLSRRPAGGDGEPWVDVTLDEAGYRTVEGLYGLDLGSRRIVADAFDDEDGIVLRGPRSDMARLLARIRGAADEEPVRRRRALLRKVARTVAEEVPGLGGGGPDGAYPGVPAPDGTEPLPRHDPDRVDDAVLALLSLVPAGGRRAFNRFPRQALARLREKGLLAAPRGDSRYVALTHLGAERSRRLLALLLSDPETP